MAKTKTVRIQDLYPKDHCFDYETFEKDPEGYKFTEADIAYCNVEELEKYLRKYHVTAYEKRLLINWVASGHSVYEAPASKYICLCGSDPYDFLDVYRMDREITKATKGMSQKDKEAYIKAYTGWTDDDISEYTPIG